MSIYDHVTSLELSLKLSELKIPQDSYLSYFKLDDGNTMIARTESYPNPVCSAYLLSELTKKIPFCTVIDGVECFCSMTIGYTKYDYDLVNIDYHYTEYNSYVSIIKINFSDKIEANALAKMIIYLAEKGLLKL